MPSKDLVPTSTAELAVIDDASPCPLWDAELKAVLSEVHAMAQDHELFPLERQAYRDTYESKLRRHVEKVDAGKWLEEIPGAPEVYQEVETRVLAPKRSLWTLSDGEIAARFNKLAEHLALMETEHQEALQDAEKWHQEALRDIRSWE